METGLPAETRDWEDLEADKVRLPILEANVSWVGGRESEEKGRCCRVSGNGVPNYPSPPKPPVGIPTLRGQLELPPLVVESRSRRNPSLISDKSPRKDGKTFEKKPLEVCVGRKCQITHSSCLMFLVLISVFIPPFPNKQLQSCSFCVAYFCVQNNCLFCVQLSSSKDDVISRIPNSTARTIHTCLE